MDITDTQSNCSNCSCANHNVFVTNLESGETFCYSLILIKGDIINESDNSCAPRSFKVKQLCVSSGSTKTTDWPVVNFQFKCLVELGLDENQITIEYCESVVKLTLMYKPRRTSFSVIPLYIICHGHDGKFQAPHGIDNSIRSACERIAHGAKLIQSLTAEKLNERKMGRKTFQLERDIDPSAPECVTFHSQLSLERARKMTPHELWEHFGRELMMSSLGSNKRKFLAFLSCTRYNPPNDGIIPRTYAEMLSLMEAHVALGGGGLAIFGSACLYTWARSVEDISPCFLNETKIDSKHFMDDSCYRGTYGSCFSTTLGSACHELGHTFDLGHSSEGIMGRGFDNIDLVFTVHCQNDIENMYSSSTCEHAVKPVFREISQNSTICLTRLLELSYTVSPPEEKLKWKPENSNLKEYVNNTNNDCNNKVSTLDNSECNLKFREKASSLNKRICGSAQSLKNISDLTYWCKSCATLLSYHRWFNSYSQESSGELKLDLDRNDVKSPFGIRVVEIRDSSGQILFTWQFLEGRKRTTFAVPPEACSIAGQLLVAEDSAGNLLKQQLPL